MVDAVFLWVDGNDPKHQLKRRQYEQGKQSATLNRNAMLPTRYKDNNEIWFAINCLRTNAKWINRIFLVTDNQQPSWLDPVTAKRLDINLVDHSALFCGYEKHLPTFNSCTIETLLHKIPGVSDEFIYLNDDFFIINATTKDDYFVDGKPIIQGQIRRTKKPNILFRKIEKIFSNAKKPGSLGPRAELKVFYPEKIIALFHTPYPISKNLYSEYLDNIIEQNIKYRFRDNEQMRPFAYYANMAARDGKAILKEPDLLYIDPKLTHKSISSQELQHAQSQAKTKHLCIQSLEEFDSKSREAVESFLDQFIY